MISILQQHYLFIIVFLILGLFTVIGNYLTVRRFSQYPELNKYPSVSVLIPARNEVANIEDCITSLLSQNYPDFEVLVLDDHSSDDTLSVLINIAKENKRLKVIEGSPLPEGWLGKHWACHQLSKRAKGELLLFTDADTRHASNMLKASVSALMTERADLITAFPREETITWGERLLVPFISFGIFVFLPIRLIQKFRWSSVSITIGQFMLFRRATYEAIGGYESVRCHVVDDIELGHRIIDNGYQWRLLDGTEYVTCRMYSGFIEAIEGFSKNLFAVFNYRILPYLLAFVVVGTTFLEPPLALISRWLGYPITSFPTDLASIAVILAFTSWLIAYHRFKFPTYLIIFYPINLILFMLVAIFSLIQSLCGTATWKNRQIERAALRWL